MQFCTISSREYLPYARVLASSIRHHQPDAEVYVLLVDDLADEVDHDAEPFVCVRNTDIGIEPAELHRLYLIHGNQFLPAIKPFFIDFLVRLTGLPTLCLDSDIGVYASLADLGALIAEHGVLLSPHVLRPLPTDGLQPDDTTIASAGMYNAGVMGFGERGLSALAFLMDRLRRECVTDIARMRVNEQRWLDFMPSFFDCAVLRDPGVNVAYWNLHERPLRTFENGVLAGDAPLRAFHFSGYDPMNPALLSRFAVDRPRISLTEQPTVATMCEHFREALWQAGFERHRGIPLPFGTLPGGIPVDATLRATYRASVVEAETRSAVMPPDGYDLRDRPAFLAWAAEAYQRRGLGLPAWATPSAGPVPSETDEAVRLLARSSSDAIANLDQRVRELERVIASLAPAATLS